MTGYGEEFKLNIIDIRHTMYKNNDVTEFLFDSEKNDLLKQTRSISFEKIIALIESGCLVGVLKHPNSKKYPDQEFYIVDVEGYAHVVPYVKDGNRVFLKTIFPSRRATKEFLKAKKEKI